MPFRILNLPDLPFESVYEHLEFKDLIHLASCSNHLKSLIQTVEHRQKKLTNLQLGMPRFEDTGGASQSISLSDESQDQTREEFHISFVASSYPSQMILSKKNIGGTAWNVWQNENGEWIVEESPEAILFWFKYLKELFRCRVKLSLSCSQKEPIFNQLFVKSDLLHVADKIEIRNSELSSARLTHILDSFHANSMKLIVFPQSDFKYEKILTRFPVFSMNHVPWLSLEHVWKMIQGGICRQLYFVRKKYCSSQDINGFIKNWLNSDNTTFEQLKFDMYLDSNQFSSDVILDGITTTPGCKKREDAAENYNRYINYEEGWDIRRKDGLLATFVMKRSSVWVISFTVWYCLNPNVLTDNNN